MIPRLTKIFIQRERERNDVYQTEGRIAGDKKVDMSVK